MRMPRLLRALALCLGLAAPDVVLATVYTQAVTVTNQAWVDLGPGPLAVGANSFNGVYIVASDAAPNVAPNVAGFGTVLSPSALAPPIQPFCGTSHYWALAIGPNASATLNVTPTNCGGSGGASAANQTNGAQQSQVVGPTGTAAATKAASTPATQADPALVTRNADIGTPGDAACATDTGSCDLNAFMQRLAQRLTAIVTTLGSPLQAGGNVAVSLPSATKAENVCTIVTPNTPVKCITAAQNVNGFALYVNPGFSNTDPIYWSDTSTSPSASSGAWALNPSTANTVGGTFSLPSWMAPGHDVWVNGASAGDQVGWHVN